MENNVYFVSGIDTDAGKSYATGYIAKVWNESGIRTVTQKFIQTGNEGMSEDIAIHRKIMGCGLLPEDEQRLTMPEIFSYPCSPHLAAGNRRQGDRLRENRNRDRYIERAVRRRPAGRCRRADGPADTYSAHNRLHQGERLSLIFVTSGRLGSISHTLLSLEAVKVQGHSFEDAGLQHVPAGKGQHHLRRYQDLS